MWNRVALLTAGVALGWNLVAWLSAPEERIARTRSNVGLAALAGLALVIWLGAENIATALVAAFVYSTGAIVTYAVRAKQILRPPDATPLLPPTNTRPSSEQRLAILVAPGPPPSYSPVAIARLQARGDLPPALSRHWLKAPAAYCQVRRAYRQHAPLPLSVSQRQAQANLGERLGSGWRVEIAYLNDEWTLEQRLLIWRKQGYYDPVLLPVDLDANELAEIRSISRDVAASDVCDAHVAPVTNIIASDVYRDTLQALLTETPPPPCPPPKPSAIEELERYAVALHA